MLVEVVAAYRGARWAGRAACLTVPVVLEVEARLRIVSDDSTHALERGGISSPLDSCLSRSDRSFCSVGKLENISLNFLKRSIAGI